jgi:hypothetical protein
MIILPTTVNDSDKLIGVNPVVDIADMEINKLSRKLTGTFCEKGNHNKRPPNNPNNK